MSKMKELYELASQQGYLEYETVVKLLKEDHGFMRHQIEDIISLLEDMGIEVRRESSKN